MSRLRTKIGVTLGVVAALSVLSTTREQREEASRRLRRYNPLFAFIAIALWALLIFYSTLRPRPLFRRAGLRWESCSLVSRALVLGVEHGSASVSVEW
jgi:hypothetical protein